MLIALIKKDVRICSLPIISGVLLLLGPFALAAALVCNLPLWTEATPATAWATLLGTGCYFSIMSSQPTLAMISGNIIAAERGDRSAEFLAYLPPSRKQILGSKFIVLAAATLIVWGFNLLVFLVADWLAGDTDAARTVISQMPSIRQFAAIGFVAVGAGWFASSISSSTGPAVAIALAAPMLVLVTLLLTNYLTDWPSELEFSRVYCVSCTVAGASLFAIGTTYFLRRIEP
jgi:ABC-type transport system involved in multi-copper enzyme maturation permease subunit